MKAVALLFGNSLPDIALKGGLMENLGFPAVSGLLAGIVAVVFGIVVLAVPRILNYIIAVLMIITGVLWLAGGSPLPGIVSIIFGIVVIIFPNVLNYLVAAYLILAGAWLIFAPHATVFGIITLASGVVVLLIPAILNYIFALYLIIAGVLAIGRYYGWF
jgi:hypothetical protein